jgi:hypothetical protein
MDWVPGRPPTLEGVQRGGRDHRDLTEITHVGVEADEQNEENEDAFAEVVEFVRVGVQMLFVELAPARGRSRRPRPVDCINTRRRTRAATAPPARHHRPRGIHARRRALMKLMGRIRSRSCRRRP